MKRGVVVRLACPVESVNGSGPSVTLSNGDIMKEDVIVAADGILWEHGVSLSIETDLGITLSSAETHIKSALVIELSLGINSAIHRTFCLDKGQLFSGIDDYMMSVPAEDIKQNPQLAHLLDTANPWWGPTGCVNAGIAGVGEDVQCSMEFCNMSGEAGREGD